MGKETYTPDIAISNEEKKNKGGGLIHFPEYPTTLLRVRKVSANALQRS